MCDAAVRSCRRGDDDVKRVVLTELMIVSVRPSVRLSVPESSVNYVAGYKAAFIAGDGGAGWGGGGKAAAGGVMGRF